ncbi:ABC transporter substrate-binding protein [Salinarimonas ramus]|uniref:Peptide ABC transporter substrate-binding protein n=1 Tax=Salinarimonas ramus TaxID=690164 RepID=A0A917V360_9HYPH|nr:ABC transporter substrate-binding protein [Salinarimonas ramus]GGK29528.1 peptide ABC transporter substrate-binding protein [Salinarimonas ramus]
MQRTAKRLALASLPLAMIFATPALAQELTIGLTSEPTAVDPHFHNLGPNNALRSHIFEGLTQADENQQNVASLASDWEAVDDTTWRFNLREGVTFSDGTPFDAQDVIYTICRVPTVQDSPSSFTGFVAGIDSIEVEDPHTMVFRTASPLPLLPTNFASVGIISAEAFGGENATYAPDGCENMGTPPQAADFNDPEKAIGTGPYKLESYVRGDSIVLSRNENYWDGTPTWEQVTMRPIANEGARVAALLAGDVDVIETPPIQDFDRLRRDGYQIAQGLSNRVIYLHLDNNAEEGHVPPGVEGTNGENPFTDVRVREAISKAIDRQAIASRLMGTLAVPAGDLLPYPMFGTREDTPVDPYDPDRSRELLAEAGYPNGFSLVLSAPNDRYMNDEKIAQAVAQMLARIGINTTVDAMTASTFFSRRNNYEYGMWLAGWGAATGEISSPLIALVATRNADTGMGATNRQNYSNPEIDALVEEAMRTVDEDAREALLQEAATMAMADYATIPLHFEVTPWAFREGLNLTPRADQYTLAMEIEPAS